MKRSLILLFCLLSLVFLMGGIVEAQVALCPIGKTCLYVCQNPVNNECAVGAFPAYSSIRDAVNSLPATGNNVNIRVAAAPEPYYFATGDCSKTDRTHNTEDKCIYANIIQGGDITIDGGWKPDFSGYYETPKLCNPANPCILNNSCGIPDPIINNNYCTFPDNSQTIIDGSKEVNGLRENYYKVFATTVKDNEPLTLAINNLTVRKGLDYLEGNHGGGISAEANGNELTLYLTNNKITGNQAPSSDAGGINILTWGGKITAVLTYNEIINNSANESGGALFEIGGDGDLEVTMEKNTISGNRARVAAGLYFNRYEHDPGGTGSPEDSVLGHFTITLSHNLIENNTAHHDSAYDPVCAQGGGIGFYLPYGPNPDEVTLESNIIRGNKAQMGAGIDLRFQPGQSVHYPNAGQMIFNSRNNIIQNNTLYDDSGTGGCVQYDATGQPTNPQPNWYFGGGVNILFHKNTLKSTFTFANDQINVGNQLNDLSLVIDDTNVGNLDICNINSTIASTARYQATGTGKLTDYNYVYQGVVGNDIIDTYDPVRRGSSGYGSIRGAYDSSSSDVIKTKNIIFSEDIDFNLAKSVILEGGYGCYDDINPIVGGTTKLKGQMNISHGTVRFQRGQFRLTNQ